MKLPPTAANRAKAEKVYDHMKEIHNLVREAEGGAMQMMRHPDATATDLMRAHKVLKGVHGWYHLELCRMATMFEHCLPSFGARRWDKLK